MEYFLLGLLGIIIFISAPVIDNILSVKKAEKQKKEAEDREFFRELREETMREEIKKELISDMKKKKKRIKRNK